jgi:hypothetical protein
MGFGPSSDIRDGHAARGFHKDKRTSVGFLLWRYSKELSLSKYLEMMPQV